MSTHGFQISHVFSKVTYPNRRSQRPRPRPIVASWRARIWPLLSCTRRGLPTTGEDNDWWCEPNGHVSRFQRGFPCCPLGFVFVALISYLFLISGSIVRQMSDSTHHIDACKSAGKSFKLCNSCFSNQAKRLVRSSSLLWKENGGYTYGLKQCVYCLLFMRRHSPKCGFRKWFLKLCDWRDEKKNWLLWRVLDSLLIDDCKFRRVSVSRLLYT